MKKAEYIAVGFVAGFASAFLGIGGGVVMVPALVLLFSYDIKKAAGISLATIVPAAFVGAVSHYFIESANIHFVSASYMVAGAVLGSKIGSILASRIHSKSLQIMFGIVLVLVGIKQTGIIIPGQAVGLITGSVIGFIALGIVAGTISALFGIGGGVVIVPSLNILFGFPIHEAIATSITVIFPTAAAGAFFHSHLGNIDKGVAFFLVLGALAGAVLGAIQSNRSAPNLLKIILGAVIILCALKMFAEGMRQRT
ncbi:MAG: TSUP family transporter [Candidatus Omnitrophica bacterium]|nr:TSUP family transporter [Candidatus Omnitrophota bacterium]